MSALIDALRAEADPPCDARGGFGSRIRRMQALMRQAADELGREPPMAKSSDVVADLRAACAGGAGKWAAAHGIAPSVVSEVLNERRDIPESIANALGYFRLTRFRKFATGARA